ncbi:MAG TPA: hypothetical protein DCE23_02915 [Firmicutes bacterium]|nr:hypothetical protein [Bacillota bacterium]
MDIVTNKLKVDNKRRIILPKDMGIVPDTKIAFMHDMYRTKLSLYYEKVLDEKLSELLRKIDELHRNGVIDYKKSLQYKRYICGILCYPYEVVDKSRRLILPREAIRVLDIRDYCYTVSDNDHIDLYRDEESYLKLKHTL